MITAADIRQMAHSDTYSAGVDYYYKKRVVQMIVDEDSEYEDIHAQVRGSGDNYYDQYILVDVKEGYVAEADCDCPDFHAYEGLCKHCVAVLLTYVEQKRSQLIKMRQQTKKEKTLGDLRGRKGMKTPTTPALKKLLQVRTKAQLLPMVAADTYGQVRLEAYLDCDRESCHVQFKIGIKHMYVLKDVLAFAKQIEENEEHSYGQKLKFVHTMGAFSTESAPLVEFIMQWVRRHASRYIQSSYYSYYNYSAPKVREMSLSTEELDEFLEAVGTRKFTANIEHTGEKEWRAVDEKPVQQLRVEGKKEGIEVRVYRKSLYVAPKHYIYFDDSKVYRIDKEKLERIGDFIECIEGLPNGKAFIETTDVPAFCRELLPALEQFYECEFVDFTEEDYGVVPVTFEIYLDAPQKNFITCDLLAVYGEQKYPVFTSGDHSGSRDIVSESMTSKAISPYFNAYDEQGCLMVLADDEELLYELLVDGIPKMQGLGEVFISDALKRMKVSAAPKVEVGISLSGDMLELSLTSEEMSKEQLIEILSKYNRKKKYYRLKSGEFINIEDDSLTALCELRQGLHLTDKQLKQEVVQIPSYRALYLDAEFKEWQALPVTKDKHFKSLIRNMKTVEDSDFEVPEALEKILREYQKRGFLWLKTLKANRLGGILADDMGLGKTLQAICFFLSEQQEADPAANCRALIVSPASLVYNWKSEFEKFAPGLLVKLVVGSAEERKAVIQSAGERDILVTSYDLLRRDIKEYSEIPFAAQIIDEAQYIKNHNTQAAKAVKEIAAGFKIALTGTPVENRLSELWSIFDYLMPGFLFSYQKFREELEIPIVQNQDEQALKRIQKMVHPFVLRRIKKDVLTDLPDKLEKNMYAAMEGEQQKLYDAHVTRMKLLLDQQTDEEFKSTKIQILSELTKLRQICCDPGILFDDYQSNSAKMDLCIDLIQNAVSGGHKILLFSQFTSMLAKIQERLTQEQISFYTLTGATGKEQRLKLVQAFNTDETSVFCISLKAGGTGLNLTGADIVIHYDPWWNVAVQNQATDRAHRIGQRQVVSVYKLILKGSIEENIVKLQEKKKELADQVLTGAGVSDGSFSKEELLELLK